MPTKCPRPGNGQFQWNAGGWFGAQLGGSLWMFIIGFSLIRKTLALGLLSLGLALLVNAVGFMLWSRRDRLTPYPCLQGLLGVVGTSTLLLLWVFDQSGQLPLLDPRFQNNPRGLYAILLMFPGLMTLFYVQNRMNRKK